MAVEFNHPIAGTRDKSASARWLAGILGLPEPTTYGPFAVLALANGVSLDFLEHDGPIESAHYAFLVSEAEFDDAVDRLREQGVTWFADPMHRQPDRWNTEDGGRGLYFDDLNGHSIELIARPHGRGGS